MPSLKHIRSRIKSVKSTKKITAAMKMIAATKLRKAEERVVASRPYADLMSQMIADLLNRDTSFETMPQLLAGTGDQTRVLIILVTSDRGLCGGFNSSIVRTMQRYIDELENLDKSAQVICLGRKGWEVLRSTKHAAKVVQTFSAFDQPKFYQAKLVAKAVLEMFANRQFDQCVMFYNRFYSVILQKVTQHQLIPYTPLAQIEAEARRERKRSSVNALYEYEPSEKAVLDRLLPNNLEVQLYRAMLENNASEHGARMTAMDSASRNADDMIGRLNLSYNRTRQAIVTNELTEILAGAEAL